MYAAAEVVTLGELKFNCVNENSWAKLEGSSSERPKVDIRLQ